MSRVLVVTNDFPPRPGGIQTFVHELVRRLDPSRVVVYTSRWRGWERFDADQPFRVVRDDTQVLLPTPGVRRRAVDLLERAKAPEDHDALIEKGERFIQQHVRE